MDSTTKESPQQNQNLPSFLTSDDIDFFDALESRDVEEEAATESEMQTLQSVIDTFNVTLTPHQHVEDKESDKQMEEITTDEQLRETLKNELLTKIAFEEKRLDLLKLEISNMTEQIDVYKNEVASRWQQIENERLKHDEINDLLAQFGLEVEMNRGKEKTVFKVRYEKLGNKSSGMVELRISNGILRVQKCVPEVKEIEQLLAEFYEHHNFLLFLIKIREYF